MGTWADAVSLLWRPHLLGTELAQAAWIASRVPSPLRVPPIKAWCGFQIAVGAFAGVVFVVLFGKGHANQSEGRCSIVGMPGRGLRAYEVAVGGGWCPSVGGRLCRLSLVRLGEFRAGVVGDR